jgi:O-antigen ligase
MEIKRKEELNSKLISILLFFLFGAASLTFLQSAYRTLPVSLWYSRYFIIGLAFLLLVVLFLKSCKLMPFKLTSFLSWFCILLWLLFSLFLLLSELMHTQFPTQGFYMIGFVPFMFFYIIPRLLKNNMTFVSILFFSHFVYLFLSVLIVTPNHFPYMGITANPNSLGIVSALTLVCLGLLLFSGHIQQKKIKVIFIPPVFLIVTYLLILSSSRTAFVVATTGVVISAFFMTLNKKVNGRTLILLITGIFVLFFSPLQQTLYNSLILKFQNFYYNENFFNGRLSIWEKVINEAKLFGNGSEYFGNFGHEGAHNSFLFVLGQYGFLAAITLSLFVFTVFVLSIVYFYKNRKVDSLAIAPLILVILFILFSMTESMFSSIGNGLTISFYLSSGIVISSLNIRRQLYGKS